MRFSYALLASIAAVSLVPAAALANTKPEVAADRSVAEAEKADAIYSQIFKELVTDSPETMTALGLDQTPKGSWAKELLDDRSLEAQEKDIDRSDRWLRLLNGVERRDLSGMDRVNYDSVRFQFALDAEAARRFPYGIRGVPKPYVVSQQNGAYQDIPDLLRSQHSIATEADAQAYLKRLTAFAGALDQETHQIDHDATKGIYPPSFIIDRTVALLRQIREGRAKDSELVSSLEERAAAAGLSGDWGANASTIVAQEVFPALDRQIAALARLKSQASSDGGVWRFPEGDKYYAFALRYYTTTDLTADQIHQMGLEQVDKISAEIDRILTAQGMVDGTVGQRLAKLGAQADQLYPDDDAGKAELLQDLNKQIAHVSELLPRYFGTLPKTGVEIRRVPKLTEDGAPGGYYMSPSLDGSRPGAYYINLRDTAEWPRWTLPTLTYHEATPGHHFQIALQQESTRIPVLRQVMSYSAFTEGWGLYAEQLADELGAYQHDPLGRVGYLQSQLFRATRLVVDTGIHSKKWSREKAIKYMVDTLGDPVSTVTTEVERYIANPGQATSYKVGHNTIAALRESAKRRLGDHFDIRAFHDIVLMTGAMPLAVLEQLVSDWVDSQLQS